MVSSCEQEQRMVAIEGIDSVLQHPCLKTLSFTPN